jgi:hypothetical protein
VAPCGGGSPRFSLEIGVGLAQTSRTVAAGDSFLATQIAFLVISGVSVVVLMGGAMWALVRSARALTAYGRTVLLPTLTGRWVARRFRTLTARSARPDQTVGSLIRLRGRVEAEKVQRAEFSGVPSVVCRHEFGDVGGGGAGEGLLVSDFRLRLEDGTAVRVRAGEAAARKALTLVDRQPQRWHGRSAEGWFWESRLTPGDELEVIGRLQRELDASAARVSDRQPALGWTVVAGAERLLLCFATRPALMTAAAHPAPGRPLSLHAPAGGRRLRPPPAA